ncbi:RING-H2 finger protein ATL54-like [Zingiber officinale]|uniref:RING-type E3 ubiquitin transferase n=1 Tax=Zingiber officinale TaxID=94328 RepID=A0A8J5G8I6_ZINOF|nr:RING-H2 finger protein ATL54-like [Zingiber officinale]KAG6500414.1 hypothetical protein ZIOFF_040259 [Zingiber officinale]
MASGADRVLWPCYSGPCSPPPLLPSPPFPPLPPTPPPPAAVRIGTHSSLIPTLPIVAATLFAAASLFIFLALYILHRRRRGGRTAAAPDADPEPAAEDDGGEVDHHIWYIRTAGLDESTIGAIATWAYKADEGVLGALRSNCAVCLSEFQDGELLRLLPKCDHAFHMGCVDTWLRSHVNCPLCRAPVVALVSTTSDGVHGASASSFSSLGSITDQAESSSVPSGLVDHNQLDGRASETDQVALEVEPMLERSELGAVPGDRNMTNRFPDSEIEMPSDIRGQGFQPIRRSFSMSSFPCAPWPNRLKLEESTKDANLRAALVIRTWRKQGNTSNGTTSLQKESGGFLSSTSDRFFSSKHGRHGRARSLLLPL